MEKQQPPQELLRDEFDRWEEDLEGMVEVVCRAKDQVNWETKIDN
jgi:hypothetical protein